MVHKHPEFLQQPGLRSENHLGSDLSQTVAYRRFDPARSSGGSSSKAVVAEAAEAGRRAVAVVEVAAEGW